MNFCDKYLLAEQHIILPEELSDSDAETEPLDSDEEESDPESAILAARRIT